MSQPDFAGEERSASGLNLRQLAAAIWTGRVTVVACIAIMTVLTIIYLHTVDYSYSAAYTLVPTSQNQAQGVSSQLGNLASLAGVNLPSSQGTSPFVIYTEALATIDVAEDMIRRNPDLMPRLFRYEWNEKAHRFEQPVSLRHMIAGLVKPLVGIPVNQWSPPGAADLQQYIANAVKAGVDPKRPVITMTYYNPDREFAGAFLEMLHASTDNVLRRLTLDRSSKYAHYLEGRLENTQTSAMRQVLIESLSQQESLIMMSSSNTSFAAQPLGKPVLSLYAVQPRGFFILLAGGFAGFALGGLLAIRGITLTSLWQKAPNLLRRR